MTSAVCWPRSGAGRSRRGGVQRRAGGEAPARARGPRPAGLSPSRGRDASLEDPRRPRGTRRRARRRSRPPRSARPTPPAAPVAEARVHVGLELGVKARDPRRVVGEARVLLEGGLAERAAEAAPLARVHDHDVDIAVLRLVRRRGRSGRVAVALPRRLHAGVEVDGGGIGQERRGWRPSEVDVEVLAAARAEPMDERGADAAECHGGGGQRSDADPATRVGGSPRRPVSAMRPLMPWAMVL